MHQCLGMRSGTVNGKKYNTIIIYNIIIAVDPSPSGPRAKISHLEWRERNVAHK